MQAPEQPLPHVQAVALTQQWQEYWWVHLPDMLHEHDHVLRKITSCYELTRGAVFCEITSLHSKQKGTNP